MIVSLYLHLYPLNIFLKSESKAESFFFLFFLVLQWRNVILWKCCAHLSGCWTWPSTAQYHLSNARWYTFAGICSGRNFFMLSWGFCRVTYCFFNCIAGGFPSHFLTFAFLNDCRVKQQFIWLIGFWRETKQLMIGSVPKALKGRWPITDLLHHMDLPTFDYFACTRRHRQTV